MFWESERSPQHNYVMFRHYKIQIINATWNPTGHDFFKYLISLEKDILIHLRYIPNEFDLSLLFVEHVHYYSSVSFNINLGIVLGSDRPTSLAVLDRSLELLTHFLLLFFFTSVIVFDITLHRTTFHTELLFYIVKRFYCFYFRKCVK